MSSFFRTSTPPAVVILTVCSPDHSLWPVLTSVESQAYPNTRLVVIIEPGLDEAVKETREFAEKSSLSTIIITNKEILGQAKSFNRGLLWVTQEAKRAYTNEPSMLWNGIPPSLVKEAGVALIDHSAIVHANRLVAPMVELNKHPEVHFVYGDPASNSDSQVCHVSGWTFRLWWLMNMKSAAVFDVENEYMNGWPTFVQMLGAGPTIRLDKPVFSYFIG